MIDVVVADPAAQIITDVVQYVHERPSQDIHIALTGGRAGQVITTALFEALGDNRHVHFWWSDERFVSRMDDDRTAPDTSTWDLQCHIHAMLSSDEAPDAQASALDYASQLHHYTTTRFCADNTMMDICILSVGPDGHIASLFPHHKELESAAAVVAVMDSPKPPAIRVTWTFQTINASRNVWLVASGSEKLQAVTALRSGADLHDIPAAGARGTIATRLYTDLPV